ncbi:Dabb family protein [Clostridiaceae bacterium]|nr:Dabb family protein [Clostridiaceae bacterium]RKI18024.1 Dabb family protein [bacterium 1XD21-70]
MIKHIVFWKIHKDGTQEERRQAIDAFRSKTEYLKSVIPQIRQAAVGSNINSGDVFHVCIDSLFDSVEDLEIYINHPEHLKVREFMNQVSYEKTVFDYEF